MIGENAVLIRQHIASTILTDEMYQAINFIKFISPKVNYGVFLIQHIRVSLM